MPESTVTLAPFVVTVTALNNSNQNFDNNWNNDVFQSTFSNGADIIPHPNGTQDPLIPFMTGSPTNGLRWINTPYFIDGFTPTKIEFVDFDWHENRLEVDMVLKFTETDSNGDVVEQHTIPVNVGADGKYYYQQENGNWSKSNDGVFWDRGYTGGPPNLQVVTNDRDS